MPKSDESPETLCVLCEQYTRLFLENDFEIPKRLTNPSDRWFIDDEKVDRWVGLAFRHHDGLQALMTSAESCKLCRLIMDDFVAEEIESCVGNLWLCPFSQPGIPTLTVESTLTVLFPGHSRRRHVVMQTSWRSRFHAAFSQQLDSRWAHAEDGVGPPGHEKWQLSRIHSEWPVKHAFRFNKHVEPSWLMEYQNMHYYKVARAIPTRTSVEDLDFKQLLILVNDCLSGHDVCRNSRNTYPYLPTRVIDVGDNADALPYLYCPENDNARYAALTHCWGGYISCTTTLETLQKWQEGIPLDEMPKTFREAVTTTRRLGIRYLWIDALCIIQDSAEDWIHEAGQMAAIYAGSAITISPLNSNSSKAGVFNFQPVAEIQLDDTWTISKIHQNFDDAVEESSLNTRAWCLQERLFATAMLHVGREQMFFECVDHNVGEDGSRSHWAMQLPADRYGPPSETADLHRMRITVQDRWYRSVHEQMIHWGGLVYEFQKRNITKGSDRLPAIAALAARFQQRSGFNYVAGLWEELLLEGLCWGPFHPRIVLHTTENPYLPDSKPIALARPKDRRIPSWSWASVEGSIIFKGSPRHPPLVEFEKIDKELYTCVNDFVEPSPNIALTLTARVAVMYYRLPEGREHVGVLSCECGDTAPIVFDGCVMDVDRRIARVCTVIWLGYPYAYSDYSKTTSLNLLMLEEQSQEHTFSRLGLCTSEVKGERIDAEFSRFEKRKIILV